MNILIAPDKFKGSFTAKEIATLISKITTSLGHKAKISPMSDGGDGFLEALETALKVDRIDSVSIDPLGRGIKTYFLFDRNHKTAYIELAKTGSLTLLKPEERNPMNTSTIGLGKQIQQALQIDAQKIYIGLGGSSTTDMGIGMATALGWKFLDNEGKSIEPIGKNLLKIKDILPPHSLPNTEFIGCVDVKNPLYGPEGAAYVYAPQKGASPWEVELLDQGLRHLAKLYKKKFGKKIGNYPGDGAAGGLGAGIRAFLNGKLIMGAEFLAQKIDLETKIKSSDLIITGEGRFDNQSRFGKAVWQVMKYAQKHKKPLLIISGSCTNVGPEYGELICLFDKDTNLETAKKLTPIVLQSRLYEYFNGN